MKAHLTSPTTGSVHVHPSTEIVIAFYLDEPRKESTNIRIDGEWAAIKGVTQPGFVETRHSIHKRTMTWGFRKRGGLPSRDIVVSAWCHPSCRTHEQRFFVRGAKTSISTHVKNGYNWCMSKGGVFQTQDAIPFPDRISIDDQGTIKMDESKWFVPQRFVNENIYIARYGLAWALVSSSKKKTFIATPEYTGTFKFGGSKVFVSDGYFHVQVDSSTTAHLPVGYRPSSTETSIKDWFCMKHKGDWDVIFGKGVHIWWNPEKMIIKHKPEPIMGRSDDMLWTSKDIKSEFEDIEILDDSHVLVNGRIYLNTMYPEIKTIR